MDEKELLKSLLAIFSVEAEEHIQSLSTSLLELEKAPEGEKQDTLIESLFREVHSLKGSSRAVNKIDIETLCQSLENAFSELKNKKLQLSIDLFDLLHRAVSHLENIIHPADNDSHGSYLQTETLGQTIEDYVRKNILQASVQMKAPTIKREPLLTSKLEKQPTTSLPQHRKATHPEAQAPLSPNNKSIRITMDRVNSVLLNVEELRSIQVNSRQRILDMEAIRQNSNALVEDQDLSLNSLISAAKHDYRSFQLLMNDLVFSLRSMLMVPFRSMVEVIEKSVRDLGRTEGKNVEFRCQGADIEIDRRILDEIREPLLHIVRNCIDHGIESPEARRSKAKSERALVCVNIAMQPNGKLNIDITDDGRGVNIAKLRQVATQTGVVQESSAQALEDQALLPFVFHSGISTSDKVSELSGRGLGLSIVQERIMNAGGSVTIESTADVGTTVHMIVPATVMTLRGVLLDLGERQFVLPVAHIEKIIRIDRSAIKTVENRSVITIADQTIALVSLTSILKMKENSHGCMVYIAILNAGTYRLAMDVGKVLYEQEILVKKLGKQMADSLHVAGVTLLGNGKIVPILNVQHLMTSAIESGLGAIQTTEHKIDHISENHQLKTILVVEDSATTRTLFKSVLEAKGFNVKIAIDGIDALSLLRMHTFDIVLSDVDMPRMNGFDLVTRIRGMEKTAELPVILISSDESREYRERGIEVGANAYIVKSRFDQEQLLEAIGRFISD